MNALPEIRLRSADYAHSALPENPLSRKAQDQLRTIGTLETFKPRTVLYSQGEPAEFVHLIAEGVVRINRCDESGHRQVLVFRVPGDFCGIPHEGVYFNSAETISEAKIYRFEWRQIQNLFLADSHLQSVLLGKILYDYRQAQVRISILGQQNISQRLASFILDLIQIPEFYETSGTCLTLPVNRFDLADYLGTAPETIARAFSKLEKLGLIHRVTARRINILDEAGLRTLHRHPRRHSSHDPDKATFLDRLEPIISGDYEAVVMCK